MADTPENPQLYFGYGSNMWRGQMEQRCPHSTFAGVGRLQNYRWQINERRYANIVKSEGDEVYGLMFSISPQDEALLDGFEGVPFAYQKQVLQIDVKPPGRSASRSPALVYISKDFTSDSVPWPEYIKRMNHGIRDGIDAGIPVVYIEKYLRPFIPTSDDLPKEEFSAPKVQN